MKSRSGTVMYDPDEWINLHEPGWEERRMLARAIVTSQPEHSVTDGPFTVSRCGDQFTIDGAMSTVILRDRKELDKIMAVIAWVDAFEDQINATGRGEGAYWWDKLLRDSRSRAKHSEADPTHVARMAPPWLQSREFNQERLSGQVRRIFNKLEIKTVSDLAAFTFPQLLAIPNLGRSTCKKITEALAQSILDGELGIRDTSIVMPGHRG